MSRIQLLETQLKAINQAKFQDYCNLMFSWNNFGFITSTGSVIAKEKTRKGIPDSYIPIGNNEYIFIEITTQENVGKKGGLYKKLIKDVKGCFDEKKSKILNNQIRKVILCFNDKIDVQQHDELRSLCNEYNTLFDAYQIDDLARAALKYPGLAQIIGVNIDTQQLLSPNQFIYEYEKGKLATPLSNKLYFRDDEISLSEIILEDKSLLLVSGQAGVGKSRLALSMIESFIDRHPTYNAVCVSNKGCPIYEDIRVYLNSDTDYLLFLDDANRFTANFSFILNLLRENREGNLKIVATVRDYALEEVKSICSNYEYGQISVKPLTDKQIREIIESDDFKIKDREFTDTIVRMAQGNPRLAIMAAKVALEKNDYTAFNEIPKVYENYFRETVEQIEKLGDISLIKILGIISFFRTIGKGYKDLDKILTIFNITSEDFWDKVVVLNELELVDLYENDIVKVSDQILGMYFFYKVFIDNQILDIRELLVNFGDQYIKNFKDLIYPISYNFGHDHIKNKIEEQLIKIIETENRNENLQGLIYSLFWHFIPNRTFLYLWSQADILTDLDEAPDYVFITDNKIYRTPPKDSAFEIVKDILRYPMLKYDEGLEIIFIYSQRKPELIPDLVSFINSDINFDKRDSGTKFYRQIKFWDKLIHEIEQKSDDKLFLGIFFNTVNSFLYAVHQKAEGGYRDNTISLYGYGLPTSKEIKEIRKKIWDTLFGLSGKYKIEVIDVINKYVNERNIWEAQLPHIKPRLWTFDSQFLIPFITNNFDNTIYEHIIIAQDYLDKLETLGISYNEELKNKFDNDYYQVSIIMDQDLLYGVRKYEYIKSIGEEYNHDKLELLKTKELSEYTKKYKPTDYLELWRKLKVIIKEFEQRADWRYGTSYFMILRDLAKKNLDKFLKTITILITSNEVVSSFSSDYSFPIMYAVLNKNKDKHEIIFKTFDDFPIVEGTIWKLSFFKIIEQEYINQNYAEELLNTLNNISFQYYFHDLDFLNKYNLDKTLYSKLIESLFVIISSPEHKVFLGYNFISTWKEMLSLGQLKAAYYNNYNYDYHFDLDGKEMKAILSVEPQFIVEFMEKYYESKYSHLRGELPIHSFNFIWELNSYQEVINELMSFAKTKHLIFLDWEHFANQIFKDTKANHMDKITNYLDYYIEQNCNDKAAMKLIFNIIVYTFESKLVYFLEKFLVKNKDSEIFGELRFYTNGVISGSAIPRLNRRLKTIEEIDIAIAQLPNQRMYVKHKQIINYELESIKSEIKWEKKREFEGFNPWG